MTWSDSEALLRSADRYGVMLLQLYRFKQSRSRCAAALQIAMHSAGGCQLTYSP